MRTEVQVLLIILGEALILLTAPVLALSVVTSLGAMVLYDLLRSHDDDKR